MSGHKMSAGKGRKRTRSTVGEPSSSSQSQLVDDDEDYMDGQSTSSATLSASRKYYNIMDASVRSRKVSALARYLLFSEGRKAPIKRRELIDKVVHEDYRAFPILLEEANSQLEAMRRKHLLQRRKDERAEGKAEPTKVATARTSDVQTHELFGLKAVEIYRTTSKGSGRNLAPPASGRSYVLVSTLPQDLTLDLVRRSKADREEAGLLTVILSLIMMKQSISEDQLWNSLGRLGLSVENRHPTFGDLKRLISIDFVNQMYLNRDKVVVGDKHSISYRWGPRVHLQVDKEELFAFVAEIYDGNLEQWKRQFADIIAQGSR